MRRLGEYAVLLLLVLLPVSAVGAVVGVTTGGAGAAAFSDTLVAEPGPAAGVACPAIAGGSAFSAPTLALPQPGTEVRVGEALPVQAWPQYEGDDFLVRFAASTGEVVCADVPFGSADAAMTFSSAGARTIVATTLSRYPTWGIGGPQPWFQSPPSAGATITVTPVVPDVAISLDPVNGSAPVGESRQWVATVTGDGEPLAERRVSFSARMPGAADVSLTGETDGSGRAFFTHSRGSPGEDSLVVEVTAFDQTATAKGVFTWAPKSDPLVVVLSTNGSSGVVGTNLSWTASVTSGDEPVAGADVRFLGQLDGAPDVDVTLTTNGSGVATHQHTREVTGTERLTVTATSGDRTATDTGRFTWLPPETGPVLAVDLAPAASGGPVGSTGAWVATVTLDGDPAPDVPVDFLGVLPGEPDEGAEDVLTDGAGQATHTHSRDVTGTEIISATASTAGQTVTAATEWTWTDEPTTTSSSTTTGSGPPGTTDPTGTTDTGTGSGPPGTDPPTTTGPPTSTGPLDGSTETSSTTTDDPEAPDDRPPPTPIPPIDTSEPPPPDAEPIEDVQLGRGSAIPGGDLEVSGAGCPPGSTVEVLLADETLASTTADATGAFSVRAPVANVPLGQYVVRIRCAAGHGEAVVDLVSTVASSTAPASAASAATVLTFFVLLGSTIVKGVFGGTG